MDGDANFKKLSAFVSRIRGEPVAPHQALTLRSVERAALASWIKREGVPIRAEWLGSSAPFSIEQLLSGDPLRHEPVPQSPGTARTATPGQVGIDMEEVDNFPVTDDYREHSFYRDNFTPEEIAHCIRQSDTRASFCGLWAAKEAIMKAGLADMALIGLNAIEITRNDLGQPTFRNCSISISHTPRAAVAVCLVV